MVGDSGQRREMPRRRQMRRRSLPLAPLLLALCVILSSTWSPPGSAAPAVSGPGLPAIVHTATGPGSSRLESASRQPAVPAGPASTQLSETARADRGGWWRQVGAALDPPQLTAKAAIAVDLTNQALLYADNPDEPLPPASTAKIVTALVAVRTLDLDEKVAVS